MQMFLVILALALAATSFVFAVVAIITGLSGGHMALPVVISGLALIGVNVCEMFIRDPGFGDD